MCCVLGRPAYTHGLHHWPIPTHHGQVCASVDDAGLYGGVSRAKEEHHDLTHIRILIPTHLPTQDTRRPSGSPISLRGTIIPAWYLVQSAVLGRPAFIHEEHYWPISPKGRYVPMVYVLIYRLYGSRAARSVRFTPGHHPLITLLHAHLELA
jgi:hypothetical protein